MRSMGYAAAVAAGLIVPLAFILPASAGAQSLALSGVSHFVGSSDSDDDDENGSDSDDNESNESDEADDESVPESADRGPYGGIDSQPDVTVYGAGLSSSGDVAFVVRVSDVGAFDVVTLSSPALDTGCALNNLTGASSQADRFGNVIFSGQAISCIPGNYKIAVTEAAEETYYGDVTVR